MNDIAKCWSRRKALLTVGGGIGWTALVGCTGSASAELDETNEHSERASALADVSTFPADIAVDWFDLLLDLTKSTAGFTPPVASRAFAYAGIALYEALVPGMSGYKSLAGLKKLTPPPSPAHPAYHWGTVANHALATIALALYPTTSAANKKAITSLRAFYDSSFVGVPAGLVSVSRQRGQAVAKHIFNWSKTDGGHAGYLKNFPTSYKPPTGPGRWVPTPGAFSPALQPYWGKNRSFAMANNGAFDPKPTMFSTATSSKFFAEAREVYDAVNKLTSQQRVIAEYWSDDPGITSTPPGHSISIASQIIEQEGVSLDYAAETYLKVGIAVADAFISCWHSKYKHNLLRPVTYIRTHIDPTWMPFLDTPPFPEHTSGHSVQSGAAAEVLTDLFGATSFVDRTHVSRGFAPRSFTSFHAFANEAAISRLYGGIHFMPAIVRGVTQGRSVGALVNKLPIYK